MSKKESYKFIFEVEMTVKSASTDTYAEMIGIERLKSLKGVKSVDTLYSYCDCDDDK